MAPSSSNAACVLVVFVISAVALGLSIAALHRATHHEVAPPSPAPTTSVAPTPLPTGVPIITYRVIGLCSPDLVYAGVQNVLFQGTLVVADTGALVPHKPIVYTVTGATPSSGNMNTDGNGIFYIVGTPTASIDQTVLVKYQYPANSVGATQNGTCARTVGPPQVVYYSYAIAILMNPIPKEVSTPVISGTVFQTGTNVRISGLSIGYLVQSIGVCTSTPASPVATNSEGQFTISVNCANPGIFTIILSIPDDSRLNSTTPALRVINVV